MYIRRLPLLIALVFALGCALASASDETSTPVSLAAEGPSTTLASDEPFFTRGTISGQSGTDQASNTEAQRDATKTALEWLFAIIVVVTVISIATWRCAQLRRRRRHRPLRSLLSGSHSDNRSESGNGFLVTQEARHSLPRTTGLPRARTLSGASVPVGTSLFYPPCLVHGRYPEPLEPAPAHLSRSMHLPVASGPGVVFGGAAEDGLERGRRSERQSRRAARGADIDEFGRRGGRPNSDDWDDKEEELPAYESVAVAGPPRYTDMNVRYVGGVPLSVAMVPEITREEGSAGREGPAERYLQREARRESPELPPLPNQQRPLEPITASERTPPSSDVNTGSTRISEQSNNPRDN